MRYSVRLSHVTCGRAVGVGVDVRLDGPAPLLRYGADDAGSASRNKSFGSGLGAVSSVGFNSVTHSHLCHVDLLQGRLT